MSLSKTTNLSFKWFWCDCYFSEVSLWWGWWRGRRWREPWGDWGVSLHTLWLLHDEAGRLQTQNAGQLGWGGIGSEVHKCKSTTIPAGYCWYVIVYYGIHLYKLYKEFSYSLTTCITIYT